MGALSAAAPSSPRRGLDTAGAPHRRTVAPPPAARARALPALNLAPRPTPAKCPPSRHMGPQQVLPGLPARARPPRRLCGPAALARRAGAPDTAVTGFRVQAWGGFTAVVAGTACSSGAARRRTWCSSDRAKKPEGRLGKAQACCCALATVCLAGFRHTDTSAPCTQ